MWSEIKEMSRDRRFMSAALNIPHIIRKSKSDNTNKKYDVYFNKFKEWCVSNEVQHLPASVSTIAIFLSSLVQKSVSESVFSAYFYSIKWNHEMNMFSNPCDNKVLHMLCEGAKRILCKSIVKKEPITPEILENIVRVYGSSDRIEDLSSVRICSMLLLGFAGFLRFNEIANLKVKNISFHDLYMSLNIEKSKTDVYRRGNSITIAKTGVDMCPVMWMKRYLDLAEISFKPEDFVFRSIRYFKSLNKYKLCSVNKPISYTRARELLHEALSTVGADVKSFGLHSLRSGGVTSGAANNVSDRLLKIHGRWKSDISRDNYIKDSLENRLSVSKNLNI